MMEQLEQREQLCTSLLVKQENKVEHHHLLPTCYQFIRLISVGYFPFIQFSDNILGVKWVKKGDTTESPKNLFECFQNQ